MQYELSTFIIILIGGLVSGVINTLAGSGSLITLPIFNLICGLPMPIANATNRIGVLVQTMVAAKSFHAHGNLPLKGAGYLAVPSVLGAIIGAYWASQTGAQALEYAVGGLMVFMFFVLMFDPRKWMRVSEASLANNRRPVVIFAFFLIGIYGGFIQAGVGIFLLAALVLLAKYDLIQSNGLKLLMVLLFSIPAILIFVWQDQIHWGYGLNMAASQAVGGWLGARFANRYPDAKKFIRYLLIAIVVVVGSKYLGLWGLIMEM